MTRKEIDKFLANTKVYVNGKSKEIQEKLFSLGYSWNNDIKSTVVCHTEAPFLFIYEDKVIIKSSDIGLFCSHENSEITAEEILSLELTEPAYRPFKSNDECWNEMHKHPDFEWVRYEDSISAIQNIAPDGITVTDGIKTSNFYFEECFVNTKFVDGTPFGIKKE